MKEIGFTRKWLLTGEIPKDDLRLSSIYIITSGYISTDPPIALHEIKKEGNANPSYHLTIKGKDCETLTNLSISYIDYDRIKSLITHEPIIIYLSEYRGYVTSEFDVYLNVSNIDADKSYGYRYAMITFKSKEDAYKFKPPEYFGKEVTNDPMYSSFHYWKTTRIDANKIITSCMIRENQDDPSMYDLYFEYKDGETEQYTSYKKADHPFLSTESFIGKTKIAAIRIFKGE